MTAQLTDTDSSPSLSRHPAGYIVILSGGSEITAVSLAETYHRLGLPLLIVSIANNSLLSHALPDTPVLHVEWPPASPLQAVEQIAAFLQAHGANPGYRFPLFATEDGGLRLLLEYRQYFDPLVVFSHARMLTMGGLDKAELFTALNDAGCEQYIAPTRLADSPDQIRQALDSLGDDCIIKPALKPVSMQLHNMPAKVLTCRDYQSRSAMMHNLESVWGYSNRWIVQRRLATPAAGEGVFYALRDRHGNITGVTASELWKQPRNGGTACWVRTHTGLYDQLHEPTNRILNAIDYIGLCELAYLVDADGRWRLLELNPRPWLQVGLAFHAAPGLAEMTLQTLDSGNVTRLAMMDDIHWINAERMLMAAVSGEQGGRIRAAAQALKLLRRADIVAIHSTSLPTVKGKWYRNMLRAALKCISR